MTTRRDEIAKPDGNTDTVFLKWVALLFMVIDHLGSAFFRGATWMRIIGRIAFPIYIWCLIVGCCYTRNIWRYLMRLLICAVLSQFFYMKALHHEYWELNVIFTLLCGAIGIALIQVNWYFSRFWGPLLALALSFMFKMDYGWQGVLLCMLMYACREKRSAVAALLIAFCLFWGSSSYSVMGYLSVKADYLSTIFPYMDTYLQARFKIQFFAVFSLLFILPRRKLPEQKRLFYNNKLVRYAGYFAYPGHLAVIALIRYLMERSV